MGSVPVWGMISSVGVGPIVCFHGSINASVYKELLRQHALPHFRKGTVETPIFMQDNAPGMNPLDNVWKIIGEKAQNRYPQNIDDLWGFWKIKGKVSLPPFVRS